MTNFYQNFLRPAIFRLDAEAAHALSIQGLKSGLLPKHSNKIHSNLAVTLAGIDFPNPVGMAAGFDKNAEVGSGVLNLGFGFHEAGSVTPFAQAGNPKPRIFRLVEDQAVINRLGFNNQGHERFAENFIFDSKSKVSGVRGINIGANKDSTNFIDDYIVGLKRFWKMADYFTANISSPNTPGLRDLQASDAFMSLLTKITDTQKQLQDETGLTRPVFIKIAPDLDENQLDDISNAVIKTKVDGLVVSNTTLSREGLKSERLSREAGGLSGRPLFEMSTVILAKMRQRVGPQLPIIGVGGIANHSDAWEKICAGANLVQLYSAMIYEGPTIARDICAGLHSVVKSHGLKHINDASSSKCNEWAVR